MSLFAFHSNFARWIHFIGSVRLCFPSHHCGIVSSVKLLHNKNNLNAQLLNQLSSLIPHSDNFQNGSKIQKKLGVTKSTEEVLLMTGLQDSFIPSEITTSLHTLVQHKYSSMSSACWSYYNSQNEMWIQANINSDIKSGFMPLLNSPDFHKLCHHLSSLLPQLSNTELLTCLHSLLCLHFPVDNKLSVHLQQSCLEKVHQFDILELAMYSSVANMLQRNGLRVNGIICSCFQEMMMTKDLNISNFHNVVTILYNISYFLSSGFMKFVMSKISDFIEDSNEEVKSTLLIQCFEAFVRHSGKVNDKLLEQFYHRLYKAIETMRIHDLRKLVMTLSISGDLNEDFKVASIERALAILSTGFLHVTDIISLINVFDTCGWTPNTVKEMEDLVLLHVHEFDALALKHASSSRFMAACQYSTVLNEFSDRIATKLSDLSNSLSCLLSVVKFYSRVHYRNAVFHFKLRNLLLEQMYTEQKIFHPSHLRVFYEYLLSTARSAKYISFAVSGIRGLLHQFTLNDIISIAGFLNKMNLQQMSLSTECIIGNLKGVLKKKVFQQQNEICDIRQLVMLDRYSLIECHTENDMIFLSKLYEKLAPTVKLQSLRISCVQLNKFLLHVPTTMQCFCDFASENKEKLHLNSVINLLETCASVYFLPTNFIDLQEVCVSKLLNADNDLFADSSHILVSSLISFAHSCAVLGHFQSEVLKLIFRKEFIISLDELSTAHQSEKELLLQKLLELNTCVVLECPDLNIPWFHENIHNPKESRFHAKYTDWKDIVSDGLSEVLGGPEYLKTKSILRPYHYNIDIECYLTNDGLPIRYSDASKMKDYVDVTRLAVIILQPHHMCSNSNHLLGTTEMKIRHLEMLGYKVIAINYKDLDQLDSNCEARSAYIKQKLSLGR